MDRVKRTTVIRLAIVAFLISAVAAAAVISARVSDQRERDQQVTSGLQEAFDAVETAAGDNDDQLLTIPEVLDGYADIDHSLTYTATPDEAAVGLIDSWKVTACLDDTCHTIDESGAIDGEEQ